MSAFTKAIGKLSASLEAQFASIFENATNKGSSREQVVIDFLQKVCPGGTGFSKGEIFDANGATSGDVDVLVYDKIFSPAFTDGTPKILAPIESLYGTIEVKSKLTTEELRDADRKAERYRALKRVQHPDGVIPITPGRNINIGAGIAVSGTGQPDLLCGAFAFENVVALSTLLEALRNSSLDYIIVPNQFVVLRNRKLDYFRVNGKPPANLLIRTTEAVALWVLLLQLHTFKTRLTLVDLLPLANSIVSQAGRIDLDGTD